VDPDAARAELPPVEDQVVRLGTHRQWIVFEQVEVVGVGHGEGMVGGQRVAGVVEPVEEREVDDPDVAVGTLVDRTTPDLEAQLPEHRAGDPMLVSDHQDEVPGGSRRDLQ